MTAARTKPWRDWLRVAVLGCGFIALIVVAWLPGRHHLARDPYAAAYRYLTEVEPGMPRAVLESHLRRVFPRPDGVEVFAHPDSDCVRLDVRLSGAGPEAAVIAVGDPYFAYAPQPNHLKTTP